MRKDEFEEALEALIDRARETKVMGLEDIVDALYGKADELQMAVDDGEVH